MPWFENQPCRLVVTPDGHGQPYLLHMEFNGKNPSLLPAKQIGSVYFELRRGLCWREVEATVEEFNKVIRALCIRHSASGEE
jgi:hypothetical protein